MPILTDFNSEEYFLIKKYEQYPLHFKGLHFVGMGGVATGGQLQRWLEIYEPNPKKCFETITLLMGKGFIRKLSPAQLRKIKLGENGEARPGKKDVIFFLTLKGFNEIKRLAVPKKDAETQADRILEQVKCGNPKGVKLYRVLHELVLAESILHWCEDYDLVWFKSENQLKSEFYTLYEKKRRAFKTSELPEYRPFPDYELHILHKETGEFQTVECEICIRMDGRQIGEKPTYFYWFCHTSKKAKQINKVTKERGAEKKATLLDDIFSPIWVQEELWCEYYRKGTKFEQQKKILAQIKEIGGIASTSLLAAYGTKTPDYYRRKLEELYGIGLLKKASSCLVPGVSRGRNENYYSLNDDDQEIDLKELTKGVLRCTVLAVAFDMGFTLKGYDRTYDAVLIQKKGVSVHVVNDHSFDSIDENLIRFWCAISLWGEDNVRVACTDRERAELYREADAGIRFYKLFELKKAKRYRRRS